MQGWPKSALYTAVGLVALGGIVIFFSWNGAAGKDYAQGQIPYLISGGVGGLALVITGLTVGVVQAMRRDMAELGQKFDALTEALQDQADAATPSRRRAS
jgi:hypothetical protein